MNFGNQTEKVDIKKAFKDMPDLVTVQIVGGSSEFKKDQQISISSEFELKKFESIVAYYNSSVTVIANEIALILLIAVCALINMKF